MAGVASLPRPRAARVAAVARSPLWVAFGVTALALALRLHGMGGTRTNPYYDAAVRSMGESWHNFFFAAYEPGASVAIDKPPLDLWFQVASTKLFGMGPAGLLLPEALAGGAAAAILFDLVRRPFGTLAGAVAAVALAVLPVSVLTARSDTMDSLMMALTVAAAWLVLRAVERGRARWLYAGALVAGLAFEVKLLEALFAVPALVLLYALGARQPRRRRAAHLAVAAAVFAGAALWWPAAVSLAPGAHPYALGSTDGSVWNATFVFNGTDRLAGSAHAGTARLHHRHRSRRVAHRTAAGPGRLLDRGHSRYGRLVGGALVAAATLALMAAALALAQYGGGERRTRRAFLWATAAWLVPGVALFSTVATLHTRYLEAVTPAIAAATGIGFAALVRAARQGRSEAVLLALAVAVPAGYAAWAAPRGSAPALLGLLAAGGALLVLAAGGTARPALRAGVALALVALFAAPLGYSLQLARRHATDSGHVGGLARAETARIADYATAHAPRARYELVAASYERAAPLIVRDGRPLLIATGVARRPLLTVPALRGDVRAGLVRYALFADHCGSARAAALRRCPSILRWLRAHGRDVSAAAGLPHGVLFRLRA